MDARRFLGALLSLSLSLSFSSRSARNFSAPALPNRIYEYGDPGGSRRQIGIADSKSSASSAFLELHRHNNNNNNNNNNNTNTKKEPRPEADRSVRRRTGSAPPPVPTNRVGGSTAESGKKTVTKSNSRVPFKSTKKMVKRKKKQRKRVPVVSWEDRCRAQVADR